MRGPWKAGMTGCRAQAAVTGPRGSVGSQQGKHLCPHLYLAMTAAAGWLHSDEWSREGEGQRPRSPGSGLTMEDSGWTEGHTEANINRIGHWVG